MGDIFQNPYKDALTWSTQGAICRYAIGSADQGSIPLVMTQIAITYQRTVTPVYPVNTDGVSTESLRKINFTGAPKGTLGVGSIYSPSVQGLQSFIEAVAAPCKSKSGSISVVIQPFGTITCATASTTITNRPEITLTGVELLSLSISIQGGETAMVNMPLAFSFTGMSWLNMSSSN